MCTIIRMFSYITLQKSFWLFLRHLTISPSILLHECMWTFSQGNSHEEVCTIILVPTFADVPIIWHNYESWAVCWLLQQVRTHAVRSQSTEETLTCIWSLLHGSYLKWESYYYYHIYRTYGHYCVSFRSVAKDESVIRPCTNQLWQNVCHLALHYEVTVDYS